MAETLHLHPTASLAERVLLPGDPGRALRLAQRLLAEPRMFNHNRGLWGYTGRAADGQPLTIQSTGMGAPSAAIVISELAELGASRLVRIGTCGALSEALQLGELVIATDALAEDGASRALGTDERVEADGAIVSALRHHAPHAPAGTIVSSDLFYDPRALERQWADRGALVVEMESAVLFSLARERQLHAASVLAVTDLLLPHRRRITTDALHDAEHRLGDVAAAALSR